MKHILRSECIICVRVSPYYKQGYLWVPLGDPDLEVPILDAVFMNGDFSSAQLQEELGVLAGVSSSSGRPLVRHHGVARPTRQCVERTLLQRRVDDVGAASTNLILFLSNKIGETPAPPKEARCAGYYKTEGSRIKMGNYYCYHFMTGEERPPVCNIRRIKEALLRLISPPNRRLPD